MEYSALLQLSVRTRPEEPASWQERRLGTSTPLHGAVEGKYIISRRDPSVGPGAQGFLGAFAGVCMMSIRPGRWVGAD